MAQVHTIQEAYERYRVPSILQTHMYWVTAMAVYVSDHLLDPTQVRRDFLIAACLLHDMGNIVKFDLDKTPDSHIQEHKEYWRKVQQEVKALYGDNEGVATVAMAREITQNGELLTLLGMSGLTKIMRAHESNDMTIKIFRYADERISPKGVVTVDERYDDIAKRYRGRDHPLADTKYLAQRRRIVQEIEKKIQTASLISLQSITTDMLDSYVRKLTTFVITSHNELVGGQNVKT